MWYARLSGTSRNDLVMGFCKRAVSFSPIKAGVICCVKYVFMYYTRMEHRVSATDLVRALGDVLNRIRYRGDSFVIERNGDPVARMTPVTESPAGRLGEALGAWKGAGKCDPDFAKVLEEVRAADTPPETPWDS